MATLTITEISLSDGAQQVFAQFGEPVDLGDAVYLENSTGTWKKANANSGTGTTETAGQYGIGIAMNTADTANQWGCIALRGQINMTGAWTQGATYIVGGGTAGDINDDADAATPNWYKTILGVARTIGAATTDQSTFILQPIVSGVTE